MRYFAAAAVVALLILHQDLWNWRSVRPFLFGLPVGLWYHVFYTLGAAALMAVLVRYAWPHELEDPEDRDE